MHDFLQIHDGENILGAGHLIRLLRKSGLSE